MPLKFDFDDDGEVKNLANLTEAQKSADIKAVRAPFKSRNRIQFLR